MASPWNDFIEKAQEIYPPLKNEELVKTILKDQGITFFKSENSSKMLSCLKEVINGWQLFLLDAREIDDKEFSSDGKVAKILNSYGIPWYKNFDFSEGLRVLQDWKEKQKFTNRGWDYPCPICGAPTKRDPKWDFMYRKECNGLGWICTEGGSKHFHSAAWAHLKPMFVESEREKLKQKQEVANEMNGTVISQS
jgi:hypothetical protein